MPPQRRRLARFVSAGPLQDVVSAAALPAVGTLLILEAAEIGEK